MTFFELFTQVVGQYPADQFFQVEFPTNSTGAVTTQAVVTIGPRANLSQCKRYTIEDKDAFAATVSTAVDGGAAVLDAFSTSLPTPVDVSMQPPASPTPPAPEVVAPAPTETTDEPTTDAVTETSTPTSDTPASDTPTTEAPTDQS